MPQRITRNDVDGVCTLTLNRPDKLNALDTTAFEELDAHLASLQSDRDAVGCVVLRGAGKGFSAGADLNALADPNRIPPPPAFKPSVIERLSKIKQPTIAAVHGVCYTGALELAIACDFIVADATARFADTHGKWGLVAAWGMSQRLPRRIGLPAAKRMMMTARTVNANEAKEIGLVDLLADEGKLDELLKEFTGQLLANSWHTNFAIKRFMVDTDGMSLANAHAHERANYPGSSRDSQQRITNFQSKK